VRDELLSGMVRRCPTIAELEKAIAALDASSMGVLPSAAASYSGLISAVAAPGWPASMPSRASSKVRRASTVLRDAAACDSASACTVCAAQGPVWGATYQYRIPHLSAFTHGGEVRVPLRASACAL
jgi:hypothetical protein